jgi:alpha-tubulin suppressor-like RCC1 family protein
VWGWNGYGSLGNGTRINSTGPELLLHNVEAIATGGSHVIAKIREDAESYGGKFLVWGNNSDGQIGLTSGTKINVPTEATWSFPNPVVGFGCGWYHSFFFLEDGSLYTCGRNSEHELGTGNTESQVAPYLVPNIKFALPRATRYGNTWTLWSGIFFWFFLGKSDMWSQFFIIPVEVIFHTLNITYVL